MKTKEGGMHQLESLKSLRMTTAKVVCGVALALLSIGAAPAAAAPTCLNGSQTVPYDSATTITLSCYGAGLTRSIVSSPSHGTLSSPISGDTVTYTPTPNTTGFETVDSFTFKANDGSDDSNTATVVLIDLPDPYGGVMPGGGTAPICFNTAQTVPSVTTPTTVGLPCFDRDGDPLTFVIATPSPPPSPPAPPWTGSLPPNYGGLTGVDWDPAGGYYGKVTAALGPTYTSTSYPPQGLDHFLFYAVDDDGNVSNFGNPVMARLVVIPDGTTGPPNNVSWYAGATPVCIPGAQTVFRNTPTSSPMVCTDPNGDPINERLVVSDPAHGTLGSIDPALGTVPYIPDADYEGVDIGFRFWGSNGTQGNEGNNGMVVLPKIPGGRLPPHCWSDSQSVAHDTPAAFQLSCADPDDNTLTYSRVGFPAHGSVTVSLSTGQATYTPDTGYEGADSFTFKARDSTSLESRTATIDLAVGPAGGLGATAQTADTTAPEISRLRATRRKVRASRAARGRGTSFRYALSEDATVTFKIRCRRRTGSKRSRTVGRFSRAAKAGKNTTAVPRKLTRKLRPSKCVASAFAVDAAGNKSKTKRAKFRVVS